MRSRLYSYPGEQEQHACLVGQDPETITQLIIDPVDFNKSPGAGNSAIDINPLLLYRNIADGNEGRMVSSFIGRGQADEVQAKGDIDESYNFV